MSSLDAFTKFLIQEQYKLIQTGGLRASKNQDLVDGETNNAQEKGKNKGKDKNNIDFNPKDKQNHSEGALGSKKDKHKKFDKAKCSYCKRGNHPENLCMKKIIDHMTRLLEQNNISLPEGAKKSYAGNNTEDYEMCHALKEGFYLS